MIGLQQERIAAQVVWRTIEVVMLDMDGTLLDRHFDDFFWERYVPERYAEKYHLEFEVAQALLLKRYNSRAGTLDWTDLDFWSEELGLDIPALKMKVDHLVQVHPYVVDFLKYCRKKRKKIFLVTNAHSKTLAIKMNRTAIGRFFDRIVCAGEVGCAKEETAFWERLHGLVDYDRNSTLFADDSEAVLRSARRHGLKHLVYVARPSSRNPPVFSSEFPSIVNFHELMSEASAGCLP